MTFWMIMSWVFVAIMTAVNGFIFLKLKTASEQMLKMAFPGSKNMGDAMAQMQKMMGAMGGMGGMPGAGMRGNPMAGKNPQQMNAQMKNAMDMLAKMQKNQPRR